MSYLENVNMESLLFISRMHEYGKFALSYQERLNMESLLCHI